MKRALKVIAFSVGYVAAYLCVLVVSIFVADFVDSNFHLAYADLVAFLFGNVLMIGLLIYWRHRTRESWIRAEAETWLADRSNRVSSRGHVWSRRLRHGILWVPSGIALAAFLFFPEIGGLVSHLFCGRSVQLNQYRLKMPLTWIVSSTSYSAWAIAGQGIGRVGTRPVLAEGTASLRNSFLPKLRSVAER